MTLELLVVVWLMLLSLQHVGERVDGRVYLSSLAVMDKHEKGMVRLNRATIKWRRPLLVIKKSNKQEEGTYITKKADWYILPRAWMEANSREPFPRSNVNPSPGVIAEWMYNKRQCLGRDALKIDAGLGGKRSTV